MKKKIKSLLSDPAALFMLMGLLGVVIGAGAVGWWIKASFR
jgi:hypothetical protein